MSHKIVFLTLGAMLFALCVPAEAQQVVGKVVRIGYLGNAKPPSDMSREEAFFLGLREYGWIEGQNIVVELRYWENRAERLSELVNEFVRQGRHHCDLYGIGGRRR
jgi:putative ABC transport system substrate-binding protein